jgi:DNA-binding SARP family transcriptional activator
MKLKGGYMDTVIKILDRLKELAPYSNEIALVLLSVALLVGFIAVCLLVGKGG